MQLNLRTFIMSPSQNDNGRRKFEIVSFILMCVPLSSLACLRK